MFNNQMRNLVAQNCNSYKPKYRTTTMMVGGLCESCNNCMNYREDKCKKGLYSEIEDIINTN